MGAEVGKGPQFYTQSWSFSKVESANKAEGSKTGISD